MKDVVGIVMRRVVVVMMMVTDLAIGLGMELGMVGIVAIMMNRSKLRNKFIYKQEWI